MNRLVRQCLTLVVLLPLGAKAANEQGLLRLWEQHKGAPEDHAAVIESCRVFAGANADDPLVPVVRGIEAWHLFKEQKTAEAGQLLQPHLTAPPSLINTGATAISKGWLTRLDRERATFALQLFYRKEVGYPASLADLLAHPKIPKKQHPAPADRFGIPWQYRLAGLKNPPGFLDQRYELLSATLGDQSELAVALKAPYGFGIDAAPVQVFPALNPPQVSFKSPGSDAVTTIPLGKQVGGLYLAYIGNEILIVCNHSYWQIFPRP